jgi:hypothetical protein
MKAVQFLHQIFNNKSRFYREQSVDSPIFLIRVLREPLRDLAILPSNSRASCFDSLIRSVAEDAQEDDSELWTCVARKESLGRHFNQDGSPKMDSIHWSSE